MPNFFLISNYHNYLYYFFLRKINQYSPNPIKPIAAMLPIIIPVIAPAPRPLDFLLSLFALFETSILYEADLVIPFSV